MKKIKFVVGSEVTFDTEHGTESGTVIAIKPHLGNGRTIAVVQVPGTQSAMPWHLPVTDLRAAKAVAA